MKAHVPVTTCRTVYLPQSDYSTLALDAPAEPSVETLNPQATCPRCATEFAPKRRDAVYCSRQCQKAATNNAARGPRRIADSAEARRIHENRKGRVKALSDSLYETPPAYRADFMQRLIAEARGNAELRCLVTNREMLRSWARLRGNRDAGGAGTGRLHIAHVLDHYCREVYGQRSYEVVNPETVLPSSDELAFPAEYFGPDAPPIYGDGILKERPCPWTEWKEKRLSALHHI